MHAPVTTASAEARDTEFRDRAASNRSSRAIGIAGGVGAALAAAAFFNNRAARKAERETPPVGAFIDVDGVRLHYVISGDGPPLVLLHGNGVLIQDMEASGLLDRAAQNYRVIAFDRPGYGYSSRPGDRVWTPRAQADLFVKALAALHVKAPIVLGHSWGTMVAAAMALDHPADVAGLVLLSGYYFPTARPDVLQQLPTAAPIVGTLLSHTLMPLLGLATGPLAVKASFSPAKVTESFDRFPAAMALRPSQLRTSAIEAALMIPGAASLHKRYGELDLPVVIMAGDGDKIAFPARHSARLHDAVPRSELRILPGVGHMIHYIATGEVMAAIDRVAERIGEPQLR